MNRSHLTIWVLMGNILSASLCAQPIAAQVVPDNTLPTGERSQVMGNPTVQIDGGARRGGNLFHSFSQFSIPTGGSAFFNNAADVQNIFSRVTGGSISNINGVIRANGTANLFLLNPNGILFGPNASLNIGGSFLASTAERFQFESNIVFSASNPQTPPLLAVSVPIGLQYGSNPGAIQVQRAILRVASDQTLALLGGTVSINGGRLLAPDGRIELGSVATGSLGLQDNGSLLSVSFTGAVQRADITLDRQAELSVRNNDNGSIAMNARNINIAGNSRVRAGIAVGLGSPQSQAGDIELNATAAVQVTGGSIIANNTGGRGNAGAVKIDAQDFVSLDQVSGIQSGITQGAVGNTGGILINTGALYLANGASFNSINQRGRGNPGDVIVNARDTVVLDSPDDPNAPIQSTSFIRSSMQGEGNGGDTNITTGTLLLRNGSTLFSGLLGGKGNAGNITINARDTVTIDGGNRRDQTSGIRSNVFVGKGNSGDINITTGSLVVRNGGVLNTNVQSFEGGSAGNININARDTVSIEGASRSGFPSRALSDVESASGDGGDITIAARSLSVSNGAVLTTQTIGQGSGGNITIHANTVGASNGGQLITTTFDVGRAGNITVNAINSITLSGSDPTYYDRLAQLSTDPSSLGLSPMSGLYASTSETSTGAGGKVTIYTPQLNIQSRAEVSVSSLGTGNAGSLFVDADRIVLNNQGSIRADTTGGGGNINLRSPFILLRNGSNITTNATGANIPGGNIGIDTRFLVAVLNEDSNISANSEDFRGGNIRINATGIYGIQPSLNATPLSDITATGATSALSGAINVITSGLDPTAGLVALPTDLADSSGLIVQGCPANQGNSFVITGRGGLPPTPEQQLDDDAEWSDRRRLTVVQQIGSKRAARSQESEASINLERSSMAAQSTTQKSELKPFPAPSLRSTERSRRSPTPNTPIIEATGWQLTHAGEILLVANTPNPTVQNRLSQPVACQGR